MIEIVTSQGERLDLSPDTEFEIEFEQPMMSADSMPTAYSTPISLPPTKENRRILDYLPAAMLEPGVKSLAVTLFFGGTPIREGTLVYDGIEDGMLQYTFAARDLSEDWSRTVDLEDGVAYLNDSTGYDNNGYAFPLIVNQDAVAKSLYGADAVSSVIKYRNYRGQFSEREVLAAPVRNMISLLTEIVPEGSKLNLTMFPSGFRRLGILCQYKGRYTVKTRTGTEVADIEADMIPAITFRDILDAVLKITGCFPFVDGKILRIIHPAYILDEPDEDFIRNWDDKVSDIFSLSREKAMNYSFKYSNNDSENTFNPDTARGEGGATEITETSTLTPLTDNTPLEEYAVYRYTPSGDIFSIRRHVHDGKSYIDADIIFHNLGKCSKDVGAESTFERSCGFELVRCIPDALIDVDAVERPAYQGRARLMAPIIPSQDVGSERGAKVYVGIIREGQNGGFCQFTDKKNYFGVNSELAQDNSINPGALWPYHQKLAEWLGKDRRCVKLALDLTVEDVASLRMYNVIFFRGRRWIIKKITLELSAGSDRIDAVGEFVEV